MKWKFVHEKFGLTDEEFAEVLIFLAECVKEDLDDIKIIERAKKVLNENQIIFTCYILGYYSCAYVCWKAMKDLGIIIPEIQFRISTLTAVYNKIKSEVDKEELKKEIISKLRASRNEIFRDESMYI